MNAVELALANSAGSQGVLKLRHMSGPWHSLCAFRCAQPGYVHRVSKLHWSHFYNGGSSVTSKKRRVRGVK